MTDINKKWTG